MALLDSEIQRIKQELGYNVLTIQAEPYVDYISLFDTVVQAYIDTGVSTTSSTAVTAATSATPVTLTVASATGFAEGMRVAIDVDYRQEVATIQTLSGTSMTVQLRNTHSGTYPVVTESGEFIVRQILRKLVAISDQMTNAFSTAGIKAVDEISFFGNSEGAQIETLNDARMYWRDELAAALGVTNMWRYRQMSSGMVSLY